MSKLLDCSAAPALARSAPRPEVQLLSMCKDIAVELLIACLAVEHHYPLSTQYCLLAPTWQLPIHSGSICAKTRRCTAVREALTRTEVVVRVQAASARIASEPLRLLAQETAAAHR